jgi:hypothetical protein
MAPDRRKHRGAHPEDCRLFSPETVPILQRAMADYSWLLTRDYPVEGALKLVGDRHQLVQRQREAVRRAGCSDAHLSQRLLKQRPPEDLKRQRLAIDGFNALITLEAALGGGPILRCRDGCLRDLSGIHGSYQAVNETAIAIEMIGQQLVTRDVAEATWFLDRPVSNSGRLRRHIEEVAARNRWPWRVEVLFNPDQALIAFQGMVVTTDSAILDRGSAWVNLNAVLIPAQVPNAWVVPMVEDGITL